MPSAVQLTRGNAGLPPTSDGLGTAAIGYLTGSPPESAYDFVALSGGQPQVLNTIGMNYEGGISVIGEASGFVAITRGSQSGTIITSYDNSGQRLGQAQLAPPDYGLAAIAPRASGGFFGLRQSRSSDGTLGPLQLTAFDGNAAALNTTTVSTAATALFVFDANGQGHALVVWEESSTVMVHARWFDDQANPLSAEFTFSIPGDVDQAWTQPLIDGTLAIIGIQGADTNVITAVADGATSNTAAPSWLPQYVKATLVPIRGAQGYALAGASVHCSGVEVLTADGTSCGCVLNDQTGTPSIGVDGSIFLTHDSATDWYPAALK